MSGALTSQKTAAAAAAADMEQTDTHIDRGAEHPMVDKMYQLRWVKLVAFKIRFEKP